MLKHYTIVFFVGYIRTIVARSVEIRHVGVGGYNLRYDNEPFCKLVI